MGKKEIIYLDLFSGIGGFAKGFQDAGLNIVNTTSARLINTQSLFINTTLKIEQMKNLRTKLSYALYTLLAVVLLSSCSDSFTDPKDRVWYGDNGMIVVKKAENDKRYGKWKYYCKDNFDEILIRTDNNWNVGDTLYIGR